MTGLQTIHEIRLSNARKLMNDSGLSRSEFADKIEMSYSLLSQYIGKNPTKNIGDETAEKIEHAFGKPKGFLDQAGNGDSGISTISEDKKFESNVSFISTPLREIPLLDYVQAGLFHDVGYDGLNPIGSTWTTYAGSKPECVFSLKVEGMSMSPIFMPGDEIIVDGSLEAKPGSLVIAQEVKHGVAKTTFKKYRVIGVNEFGVDVIELVPLNPDFPTLNSLQIDISIIGVVVRHNREV
ncbi:MAG: LexA family transcriptional regulator [Acinetobacter sp.]|nr:LexA family transcriptional regulator [Acinetobacter sp.]